MNKKRILITAIGGGGHGNQVLKALLMERDRYEIIGADANPECGQASTVDHFVQLPFASDANYIKILLDYCEQLKIDALIHGCDPELILFNKYRKLIEDAGIFLPINSSSLIEICMNKAMTNSCLKDLGFHAPKYLNVTSESELSTIDWFPVVVKPVVGGGGSANVFIAQDAKELSGLASYLGLGAITRGFMIQEYIGTPEQEFTVGVLHDLNGQYINSIALRRHLTSGLSVRTSVANRTKKKELGNRLVISSGVSQGDIGRFPEVTEKCREIADRLGSCGPLNFQCRFFEGKVHIFEINPRFSGTTSLRAMVGLNEPDLLIRHHCMHEKIGTNFSYREGTILRSLSESIVSEN